MSSLTQMWESFDSLKDAGTGGRTKRFREGAEEWESFSLKEMMEFEDWYTARQTPPGFTGIVPVDV